MTPHHIMQTSHGPREHWQVEAGSKDVAVLSIPADLRRERVFDIDGRFVVKRRADADQAWHEMTVTVNGTLEWSRRIETGNPGHTDSLDYHFRRVLPAGEALRVVASTNVSGALRVRLAWEALEGS